MNRKILCYLMAFGFMTWSCSTGDDESLAEENIEIEETLTISESILKLVNDHRQSIGKSALTRNSIADNLAADHANYMIVQKRISHDNFSDRFQSLQQYVNARGAGENVAYGYPDAETVMEGWLNSSGHKANIEGDFTHIGIAAIKNSEGVYYYAQLFYR